MQRRAWVHASGNGATGHPSAAVFSKPIHRCTILGVVQRVARQFWSNLLPHCFFYFQNGQGDHLTLARRSFWCPPRRSFRPMTLGWKNVRDDRGLEQASSVDSEMPTILGQDLGKKMFVALILRILALVTEDLCWTKFKNILLVNRWRFTKSQPTRLTPAQSSISIASLDTYRR